MGQRSQHGGGAQLTDRAWQAFCADRTQAKLDDAIKGYHADFSVATEITVDEIWGVIRLGLRMTHVIDETLFPGMAKYPVDNKEKCWTIIRVSQKLGKPGIERNSRRVMEYCTACSS